MEQSLMDKLTILADSAKYDVACTSSGASHPAKRGTIGADIFVSTRDAFAEIKPVRPAVSLKEIVKQPMETWKNSMKNDFEDSVFKKFPEIAAIKDELYDLGAVYAAMSGSGSSVYGIFKAPIENVEDKFCGCFCRQRALE